MKWIIEKLRHERIHRNKMLGTTPPTSWEGSQETWDLKEQDAIRDLIRSEKILKEDNEPTKEVNKAKQTELIPVVSDLLVAYDEYIKEVEEGGCVISDQKLFHKGFLATYNR